MCAHICSDTVWKVLCPFVVSNGTVSHIAGIFVAIPHIIFTRKGIFHALYEICFRQEGLSNVFGVTSAVLIFLVATYFNHWKVEFVLNNDKSRKEYRHAVKLLYTSRLETLTIELELYVYKY
jgi:preprotein translocase subunit SecY